MADENEQPYENIALQAIGKLIPPGFDAEAVLEAYLLMRIREKAIREAWEAIAVDLSDHGMAMVSFDLDGHVRHIQRAAWHRFESAARDTVRPYDFTT